MCVAAVVGLSVCGCNEEDLTSIKLSFDTDGRGVLLSTVTQAGSSKSDPVTKVSSGLAWKDKLSIVFREAAFDDMSAVEIAGIRASVSYSETNNTFKLTVPLGQEAKWTEVLAASRKDADAVHRLGKEQGLAVSRTLGTKFKFDVSVPGEVLSDSSQPRRIAEDSSGGLFSFGSGGGGDNNSASLVLPLKKVRESDKEELVWLVHWK